MSSNHASQAPGDADADSSKAQARSRQTALCQAPAEPCRISCGGGSPVPEPQGPCSAPGPRRPRARRRPRKPPPRGSVGPPLSAVLSGRGLSSASAAPTAPTAAAAGERPQICRGSGGGPSRAARPRSARGSGFSLWDNGRVCAGGAPVAPPRRPAERAGPGVLWSGLSRGYRKGSACFCSSTGAQGTLAEKRR